VINHDKFVIHNGSLLTARLTGASYQWVNCTRGYKLMDTATNLSYVAKTNEEYAVIMTKDGCTDTSDCVLVTNASAKFANLFRFILKPNPNNGKFIIQSSIQEPVDIRILDLGGKLVFEATDIHLNTFQFNLKLNAGIYFIQAKGFHNQQFTQKFIIE
jgi:hypothetical protein